MKNIINTLRLFVCLLAITLTGCSEIADTEDEGITVSWQVLKYALKEEIFYQSRTEEIISDVNVCGFVCTDDSCTKYEEIACTETANNGVFELHGLPKHSKILLTFEKDGLASRLVALQTGKNNLIPANTYNFGDIPPVFRFPPMTDPIEGDKKSTGAIIALAMEFDLNGSIRGAVEGTRVSIDGKKPDYYTDKYGNPGKYEAIKDGFAGFEGLEPGSYIVKYEFPESEYYSCYIGDAMADRLVWGFQTEAPNQTLVPVMRGFRTITLIICYNTIAPPDPENDS